ncbi:MAG: DUF5320 domain-containing protein [Thermodesulfobacteriota bacterium]|nr:DUF5320 domain-containing protein [Thermodesulfobacteriota bacterium]
MPGYDSTGPMGQGPKTGRGLGRCGKAKTAGSLDIASDGVVRLDDSPIAGRGSGRGGRMGRRGGRGRI